MIRTTPIFLVLIELYKIENPEYRGPKADLLEPGEESELLGEGPDY
jgi:hypothetical protein